MKPSVNDLVFNAGEIGMGFLRTHPDEGRLVFVADTARTAGEASYLYELVSESERGK